MNYMIGCNYWGSKYGTEMWANWDGESVDKDLEILSEYGVKYMRVFPIWRDFQPIHTLYMFENEKREYRLHGKTLLTDEFGLDEACMEHFAEFLGYVKKHGMKVIVSIVTGWMSGRMFVPPAIEGRNIINDPEALKLQVKFVRGFVRRFKNSDVIEYWDLGNECNCMSKAATEEEAYMWTATIANAIRSEDNTRKIQSGMHSLYTTGVWTIQDQAEHTDVLTPHPYPSPTVNGDRDVMTGPRTSYITTQMIEYYSGVGGKPAIIQECGTFSDMVGRKEMAAKFMRMCLYSGWANGSLGYLWWCAHEQVLLPYPPYSWSMMERELGLLYEDYSPKPVALQMKECQEVLSNMPFEELPKKKYDAVCICTGETRGDALGKIQIPYMLCKQAGLDMTYREQHQTLPEVPLYIIPSVDGWACLDLECYDTIRNRVKNGANAIFTVGSGLLAMPEATLGLTSEGMRNSVATKQVDFGGYTLPVCYEKEFIMRETTAEVLAKDDNGNVVFSRNKLGNGYIYYLAFPMERMLTKNEVMMRDPEKYPFYRIYAKCAEKAIEEKFAKSMIPDVGVTTHWFNERECVVVAINYSGKKVNPELVIKEHSKCEVLHGSIDSIDECEMTVLKVTL